MNARGVGAVLAVVFGFAAAPEVVSIELAVGPNGERVLRVSKDTPIPVVLDALSEWKGEEFARQVSAALLTGEVQLQYV